MAEDFSDADDADFAGDRICSPVSPEADHDHAVQIIRGCETNEAFVNARKWGGTFNLKCALCFENFYREHCKGEPSIARTEICHLVAES